MNSCSQNDYKKPSPEKVNPNEESKKDKIFLMQVTLFFQFMSKSRLPGAPEFCDLPLNLGKNFPVI
jgi:hypothetical protein